MKIVIIDNYDSFTYNLSHLVKELGAEVTVYRNDQFELSQLEEFSKIILSPGPGIPSEAGLLLDVIRTFVSRNGELWFQAGGGIVAKSNEEYELQEVNNKLGAFRRAILMAEDM